MSEWLDPSELLKFGDGVISIKTKNGEFTAISCVFRDGIHDIHVNNPVMEFYYDRNNKKFVRGYVDEILGWKPIKQDDKQ